MLVAATLAKLGLAQFHMILYRNSRYADIKICTQVIGEETSSLSCYICGDNNLPEFGECSTQFKYDCTNYASRFGQDVRMFCRTTRHRAENGTYTIMKECISEKDHHMTFPEKSYKLDEECDLIDVKGKEVAYCLCRSPLCNQVPIAEQFMAFEEKHPELFGDTSADDDSDLTSGESRKSSPLSPSPALPNMPAPQQSAAFGVSSLNQQRPIVPVNDPRSSAGGDIRRSQLPSRGAETADANKGMDAAAGLSGNGQPVSRGQFVSIKQSGEQIKISPTKQG
ncbi:hypothetical protein WR25_02825 [Diploscapter pachys]|uniref:Uncharacterized protein n=1 Tax=Diploscapter pachys TaxID=2018661 RepID=A0A2A2KGD5_9BILA|nr:hypothetical protein WR25_02825 [Diploscapter pachys]